MIASRKPVASPSVRYSRAASSKLVKTSPRSYSYMPASKMPLIVNERVRGAKPGGRHDRLGEYEHDLVADIDTEQGGELHADHGAIAARQ